VPESEVTAVFRVPTNPDGDVEVKMGAMVLGFAVERVEHG